MLLRTRSRTSPMKGATSSKEPARGNPGSHCRAAVTALKSPSNSSRRRPLARGDPYPALFHSLPIRSARSACAFCETDS